MSFVRPEEIVKRFGLASGMTVADFGCGSGHFSLAASKIVGDRGKIYSLDVQKNLLEALKSLAELEHIKNIEILWTNLEMGNGSKMADASVDFVIISNILFQADDKTALAKETKRILKDKGRVAVIEWNKDGRKIGPASERRISQEEAQDIFIKEGFKKETDFEAGEGHYGIIFIKK
jgi:ubiquinone/menaquinone biosynthesis C-methylase UbiE